ncbi:MAG: nickel-responsive transcriptional regulator NikR [Deferribacteraceae bacterium]|jgi:CopG family nickel-responsive transcriptional regulator|nr:nickel-responsive transcriptional regulator NikR [Deferribacteraceae bacterium]
MNELIRFGVAMPASLLEEFDSLIERSGFANRSLALRHLVRQHIAEKSWEQDSVGTVCGTITMLYDHHSNEVSSELTSVQHDFGGQITCTTHVHVSHELCLETIIVNGSVEQLKRLEETLTALKGIQSVHIAVFKL